MNPGPAELAAFWDRRILDWEASRYEGRLAAGLGPAEWAAYLYPEPTLARRRLAVELLAPFLRGRRVLEAGCGTGRLAGALLEAGAAGYRGLDHSPRAIEAGRRRALAEGLTKAAFETRDASELPAGHDLVVSLGLVDWLDDRALRSFFERHLQADFLHTFSERRAHPRQWLQRAGRGIFRRMNPRAIQPRFLSLDELRPVLPSAACACLYVVRDPRLRDATIVSSLPLAGAVPVPGSLGR
ncbi:MAG: class I SAM-dependent methyltransferase [Elusimicrobia bacterium]|nr:class I SAM-dependent methyltransferase [Elusimicrobiota bacterium]